MLLLFVSTTVVGALLSPHPRGPQPSALGDFSVPTASEGRAIPVVFGTVMIKGGNTVWWGDLKSAPIKVGGGILSFGKTQTIGYKYSLGCQFMLCHGPVDALVDIQADVKSIPNSKSTILNGDGSENFIQVSATGDNLFGGTAPGGGGGISGVINFYRGLDTQQPDDYLGAKQGRLVLDQSGIGYTFHGTGNGTITAESAGSSSLDETITITAIGIDGNVLHSTFGKMRFSVVGSRSGGQSNSTLNSDGSNGCWADQAFSCPIINMTIQTGSTQYVNGDVFTIITQHAHVAPAYRRLCYAVFKQLYVGTSSYLKALAFVVRRCPDPLGQGAGVANINGDANPALAVFELLTNPDYGLGIPGPRMDGTSFAAAAVTLASEGLGISMQFDTQASADQLIGEILRHCDGMLYTDPSTGLWTITLARADYDPTTLPVLTVDSVLATPDFSRGSWSETTNLVTINFLSRLNNFNDRIVRAYDAANIEVTGEVRPQTIDFKGISTEAAAALVAIRVLKTLTYPLSKIKLVVNRSAWQFRPGGVFRFTWVPLGIINQVFRITRIGYGELTDGKITMDAVEDIFGISSVAFVAPPISGWVNPLGVPVPNLHEKIMEVPKDIAAADVLPDFEVMCMAARDASVSAKTFQIWRDDGSGYSDSGVASPFCPWAKLSVAYPAGTIANDPVGFTVDGATAIDMDLLDSVNGIDLLNAANLAVIDDEIISWETITKNIDGSYTISGVLRGLMDTVPADHAINAPIFFFSGLAAPISVLPGETLAIKLLPTNSAGTLPIGSATAHSITIPASVGPIAKSRFFEPYPMGNVCMQGLPYATRLRTIVGDLVLTWSQRSAGAQAGQRPITRQDDGDILWGSSIATELDLFIGGGAVAVLTPGSPNTYTITAAHRATLGAADDTALTVMLRTFFTAATGVGSTTCYSLQQHRLDVIFTGFGLCFGEFFGGLNS